MGYRGEDLDLRTPHGEGAADTAFGEPPGIERAFGTPGEPSEYLGANPGGPIWVDDTLLECSNQAFDIAMAHRAPEVGIEHLVFALTRTAADALEARGVRVAALRREAAAEIVSESAVASATNGKIAPRRSADIEELLRQAAAHAYRRNAPAGVDDVLDILAGAEPGFEARLAMRPSLRRLARGLALGGRERSGLRDYRAADSRPSTRTELTTRSAAASQGSRLEALEQMVRALSSNLANERKILSGVLHDLQREIMAHRDDTTRLGAGTHERMTSGFGGRENVEHGFLSSRTPFGADVSLLHERIGSLERALQAELAETRAALETLAQKPDQALDLTTVSHRLDIIEEAVLAQDLPDRLASLEAALSAESTRASAASETLMSEVKTLASSVAGIPAGEIAWPPEATERLDALQRTVEESASRTAEAQAAFSEERSTLHEALVKLNGNQHTLANSLGTWRKESSDVSGALAERLETLERSTMTSIETLESVSEAVGNIQRMLADRHYRRHRFWFWLFGTDDWIRASWPLQSARIAEDMKSRRARAAL